MSDMAQSGPGPKPRPCIIILAAPSGSGKTTIATRLMSNRPAISFSVSATTRPAREHEVSGVHYHFMSTQTFKQHLGRGELLESEEVYPGCWYGTLVSEITSSSRSAPVLLDIDVVGAINVKKEYGDRCLAVFIRPPSLVELENRLRARGTESAESLAERVGKAKHEITYAASFDAVVVNDNLEDAVSEVIKLVDAFIVTC